MFRHILEDFVMWPRTIPLMDTEANSYATGLECLDPSRAIQSQKEEADINTIVKNFGVTGQMPVSVRAPTYGDFTGIDDYQSALHAIKAAEDAFTALPSAVRNRFENNPALFVDFCSDSANLEEMRKLGLAPPAPAPDGAPS